MYLQTSISLIVNNSSLLTQQFQTFRAVSAPSNNLPGYFITFINGSAHTKVGLTANEVMFQTPDGDQVFYRKFGVTNYT